MNVLRQKSSVRLRVYVGVDCFLADLTDHRAASRSSIEVPGVVIDK